jgi:hypothetical protein
MAIGVVFFAVINVNLNKSSKLSSLSEFALVNLEALSSEGSGIPTKVCYTRNDNSTQPYQVKLKCPSGTTPTNMEDCPTSDDFFPLGSTDKCHDTSSN